MNHKTLKNIAHNIESLDAGTVQDLIEMTKRFPYFAWPFVLLAKQYQQKQDFRAEALMHQAALRVHDRSWLYTFSHTSNRAIEEQITQPAESKIDTQIPIVAISEVITPEQPILVETQVISPVVEPQELVATEVQTPAPVVEPPILLETQAIAPVVEPQELAATEVQTPDTPLPVSSAFVSNPKRIQRGNERRPLFTPEIGQVYNLEQIFNEKQMLEQEPQEGKASTDFYAWLNAAPQKATLPTPISQEQKQVPLSEFPESMAQQKSIIENFLINKPSISRPKQEFFKPEKAQKKGEVLSGAIVTETLAQIYLKQDNPQKAIWAYQQLQLKFPEKKTYFANLISKIKIEQNES